MAGQTLIPTNSAILAIDFAHFLPESAGVQFVEDCTLKAIGAFDVPAAERVTNPALLIVDMQNDFVRRGAPMEVVQARATIGSIQTLIGSFRRRGHPVIYTRFLGNDQAGLMWLWSRQCWPDIKCCWPQHERLYMDADGPLQCADVIEELSPQHNDLVIDKYCYGSFHGTNLHQHLQSLGIVSLVVTGTVTQICVEETAREAFHLGYRTTLASDAVSSFAPDLQAATLKNFEMKFGWVADTRSILGWLGDSAVL